MARSAEKGVPRKSVVRNARAAAPSRLRTASENSISRPATVGIPAPDRPDVRPIDERPTDERPTDERPTDEPPVDREIDRVTDHETDRLTDHETDRVADHRPVDERPQD